MASESSAANDLCHERGLSMEEIAKRYSEWAQDDRYDWDLREENYRGPVIATEAICALYPDVSKRSNIKILDVAAGTGFAGLRLKQQGFTNIDALEPSEGMMDLAKNKHIYNETFLDFLGKEPTEIMSDTYDLSIIVGGMGQGHIPCDGLYEFIRVTKPGGLAVIVMREQYLTTVEEYRGRLEPLMNQLVKEGRWETVSRTVVPRYSFNNNGLVFVFRVKN